MVKLLGGQRTWLWQRLTAIYVGLYVLVAILVLLFAAPASHAEWHAWMTRPSVALLTALCMFLLLLHAWIGLRDVILDYLRRPLALRLTALSLSALAFLYLGLWGFWILLEASLR